MTEKTRPRRGESEPGAGRVTGNQTAEDSASATSFISSVNFSSSAVVSLTDVKDGYFPKIVEVLFTYFAVQFVPDVVILLWRKPQAGIPSPRCRTPD